jgi:hypothetical protein
MWYLCIPGNSVVYMGCSLAHVLRFGLSPQQQRMLQEVYRRIRRTFPCLLCLVDTGARSMLMVLGLLETVVAQSTSCSQLGLYVVVVRPGLV